MNCEEVKINLNDYVDEELDEFTRKEVELHIRHCDLCIKEYKKLMLLFDRLKNLPVTINPPSDLIDKVKEELLKQSGVTQSFTSDKETKRIIKERKRQSQLLTKTNPVLRKSKVAKQIARKRLQIDTPKSTKKFIIVTLVTLLIIVGYIIYDESLKNYPWQVSSLEGKTLIENKNNNLWFQGEKLKTEEKSKAKISVPAVGVMYVDENSLIELYKGKKGNNQVKVHNGKIRIVNTELIPALKFIINNTEIIDRAGEFILKVDKYQNIDIEVISGFVEINQNGKKYFVDKKNICKISRGIKPGLPVRVDASDSLKNAVSAFNNKNGNDDIVEKIINNAKQNDMLTLLALIPEVKELQRQIIFQIISNYFPPPETITRAGIIRLDEEMLYRWWEEIEWQI